MQRLEDVTVWQPRKYNDSATLWRNGGQGLKVRWRITANRHGRPVMPSRNLDHPRTRAAAIRQWREQTGTTQSKINGTKVL